MRGWSVKVPRLTLARRRCSSRRGSSTRATHRIGLAARTHVALAECDCRAATSALTGHLRASWLSGNVITTQHARARRRRLWCGSRRRRGLNLRGWRRSDLTRRALALRRLRSLWWRGGNRCRWGRRRSSSCGCWRRSGSRCGWSSNRFARLNGVGNGHIFAAVFARELFACVILRNGVVLTAGFALKLDFIHGVACFSQF